MSYQLNYQAASYLAGVDLSAAQNKLVVLDVTAGTVRLPTSASEYAEGVLENAPEINMPATVSYQGITKVIVDAAYGIGQALCCKYDATAGLTGVYNTGSATTSAAAPFVTRLRALEASSAAGDIIACRFVDGGVTGMLL
jgi:hypothetical protein